MFKSGFVNHRRQDPQAGVARRPGASPRSACHGCAVEIHPYRRYSGISSTQAIIVHAAFGGAQMPQLELQQ